jgi:hypothetical protein
MSISIVLELILLPDFIYYIKIFLKVCNKWEYHHRI